MAAQLALAGRPPAEQVPAVERTLFAHLRRECMARYREEPAAEAARERAFLRAHAGLALRSAAREITDQMLYPSRPYGPVRLAGLYGGWPFPAAGERSGAMVVFWLAALAATLALARRDPGLTLFLVAATVLVMLPAANSHLAGARFRYPLDLFFLPVVVALAADAVHRYRYRSGDRAAGAR